MEDTQTEEKTQTRRSCEDRGRAWCEVTPSQGTPRIAFTYHKLEEAISPGTFGESMDLPTPQF